MSADDQTQQGQCSPPPQNSLPAFHAFPPDAQKADCLRQTHARDAAAAETADAMRAFRRTPQYDTANQALGGQHAATSPQEVAAQRLRMLSNPRTDPKIRRHIESEERKLEEKAQQRHEDEAKLARARERSAARVVYEARIRIEPEMRQRVNFMTAEARSLSRRIITNILDAPNDERKRKLRLSNSTLQPIATSPEAKALLRSIGFAEVSEGGEPYLRLPLTAHGLREHLEHAKHALDAASLSVSPTRHSGAGASSSTSGLTRPPVPDPPLNRHILCPLSMDVMEDPVITCVGTTYSREEIEKWFAACVAEGNPPTDPLTGQRLATVHLIPNLAVRGEALAYHEARGPAGMRAPAETAPADYSGQHAQSAYTSEGPPARRPAPPPTPTNARERAGANSIPHELLVEQLVHMGFDEQDSFEALANVDGDLNGAIGLLCPSLT